MKYSRKEFDAIVVGSGPGSATVARELSLNGKKVLILEWGDNDPVKGNFSQTISRGLIPGKGMLVTGQALGMVRGITTGGSSLLYCATAFDPPTAMLKSYGIDITTEIDEVRKDIPNDTLSDELMSPAGERFMESALDLGYNCKKLNKFIYQNKCKPDCQRCLYGCPYGAKWNARNFVNEALENGATIMNHAKVDKVIIEHKKAIGVEYKFGKDYFSAFAPKIIIGAGGIGSPNILRKSGIHGVGYDFFFDPLIYVLGKIKDVKSGRGLSMCSGIHFPEDGIVMTDFNLPHLMKIMFDLEVFKFVQSFSYSNVVPIMIKVRDSLGGRVINDRLIWKRLIESDKHKLNKGAEHAKKILENAGATDVYRSWYLAAHPGGTVKIGEHVNSDLETRFANLYVCDCSVMPEEWGLPPTMTILCLGKRLAKHLLGVKQIADEKRATSAAVKNMPPGEERVPY
ncbi:MAG: GMC family oxidoreductase [Deltaproteobacteria bacterium]|nr:GMC family oxidoreductase [Deltaproteobacteria bacterium]